MESIDSKKNCIFVGGIASEATPATVNAYFSRFGSISKVKLNKTRSGQRDRSGLVVQHRGCGFIEMETKEDLARVLNHGDHFLLGQKLDCRVAMTNRERKSYHQALNEERRKIFIGRLPKDITKEKIESFFKNLVDIEETTLIQKESKDFAICFLLLKEKYAGQELIGKTFEIQPNVLVECQLALNPQQLYQRKLGENPEETFDDWHLNNKDENIEDDRSLGRSLDLPQKNMRDIVQKRSVESGLSTQGGNSLSRRIIKVGSGYEQYSGHHYIDSSESFQKADLHISERSQDSLVEKPKFHQNMTQYQANSQLTGSYTQSTSYDQRWKGDGENQRTPAYSKGCIIHSSNDLLNLNEKPRDGMRRFEEPRLLLGRKSFSPQMEPLNDFQEMKHSNARHLEVDSPFPLEWTSKPSGRRSALPGNPNLKDLYSLMKSKVLGIQVKGGHRFYSPFQF